MMMRAVSVGQKDKMYTSLCQKATKAYYKQIDEINYHLSIKKERAIISGMR